MHKLQVQGQFEGRSVQSASWSALSINPEAFIRAELENMSEELRWILDINRSHQQTLHGLIEHVGKLLQSTPGPEQDKHDEQDSDDLQSPSSHSAQKGKYIPTAIPTNEETLRNFIPRANKVMTRIQDRMTKLDNMLKTAHSLSTSASTQNHHHKQYILSVANPEPENIAGRSPNYSL